MDGQDDEKYQQSRARCQLWLAEIANTYPNPLDSTHQVDYYNPCQRSARGEFARSGHSAAICGKELMKRRLILSLLVLSAIIGSTHLSLPADAGQTAGILLEWEGPRYQLTTVVGDDGQTYTHVEVEAASFTNGGAPGLPSLPRRGRLVALPPNSDFGLQLIEVVYETVSLEHPVEPAPVPGPAQFDAVDQQLPREWIVAPDHAVYTSDAAYPAEFVTLGEAVWMRDHRLARLTFTPFRYHPTERTLDVVHHVRLRVWWEPPATPAATAAAPDDTLSNSALASLVLNPSDLDSFRAQDRTQMLRNLVEGRSNTETSAYSRASASPLYKVHVATEGIYALDYSTLVAAGLPIEDIDPATLRLTHDGIEVAGHWEGDSDLAFEAGERLLFYARPQLTRFAGYDVYWLSWGSGAGQRMASRPGAPTGLPSGIAWTTTQVEENTQYDWLHAGRDGDHWFWRGLKLPDLVNDTFEITLETPTPGTTGVLRVWLRGITSAAPDPDHHVRFSVNGSAVGEAKWEGEIVYTATLNLPNGLLQADLNTVDASLPGDTGAAVEGTWIDAIAISYALEAVNGDVARFRGQASTSAYTIGGFSNNSLRVYDVTDQNAPRIVTGSAINEGSISVGDSGPTPAEYLIVSDDQIQIPQALIIAKAVSDPPSGADYLIITHPDFEAALAPLVAHRAAQGLRVVSVDVEGIYDEFGDGRMDPAAIQSFLAHAYANWPGPALQYVLLVGDGTYDPRGYRPDTNPTYLPPFLADVDLELGETASDNHYADLSGDLLPEVRLGRFPVNTAAEAEAIVDKTISYETDPLPGEWNRRLVFGADNPSDAGDHHAHADGEFITYATPKYGYQGARVYFSETADAPHLYDDAEAAQNALIAELNQGALFYTYFGHASWHQEAVLETDNYAPLFHRDHIARLSNQRQWPVVLHMTCLTGLYTHLTSNTLDESLLRTKDVGAVAVLGASGYGVATGHMVLHRSLYQAVFDYGQTELSGAINAAQTNLYAVGIYNDLIETYHLFGDPALALNTSARDLPFSTFLPIIERGF